MRYAIATVFAAAVSILAAATPATAAPTAPTIKIGMITTLSGGGAHLGVDVRDGFMLAVQQSGRQDIEVMVEDDANKPDVAKAIADKFIQRDQVRLLTGIIWSNLVLAVAPPRPHQPGRVLHQPQRRSQRPRR